MEKLVAGTLLCEYGVSVIMQLIYNKKCLLDFNILPDFDAWLPNGVQTFFSFEMFEMYREAHLSLAYMMFFHLNSIIKLLFCQAVTSDLYQVSEVWNINLWYFIVKYFAFFLFQIEKLLTNVYLLKFCIDILIHISF